MGYAAFERITQLATGYWQTAALNAAATLGVFEALEQAGGTASAEAVAKAKGLAADHTRDLLDALTGMGLCERDEAGYRIAGDYEAYLRSNGQRCLLGALRLNEAMYGMWGRLAEGIRSGKPVVEPAAHRENDAARTRGFVMGMHSRALGLAEVILPAIAVKGRKRLLDVGAGPGTFSRQTAEAAEGLAVTMLDLPAVVAVAKELTVGSRAAERIDFMAADYRREPLPSGYDVILFCGALHQENEAEAAALFGRMYEALEAGGELLVIDLMTEDDGISPVFSRLFSLNMKLLKADAGVFCARRVATMLGEAGFEQITHERLEPSAYWKVRGIKQRGAA